MSALPDDAVTLWGAPAEWQKFSTGPTAPLDTQDFFSAPKVFQVESKPSGFQNH